jgi:hypothetical protein
MAEGLWLEGVGHVFPLPDMNQLNAKILEHIKAASSPNPDD